MPPQKARQKAMILGAAFGGIYLLAGFLPEWLWGIHFWALLPKSASIFVMLLAILLLAWPLYESRIPPLGKISGPSWTFWAIPAILMMALGVLFPIHYDYLGDSFFIYPQTNGIVKQWDPALLTTLFEPTVFDPKTGEGFFYAFHSLISYLFGIKVSEGIWIVEIISLGLFGLLWARLVFKNLTAPVARYSFLLAGLSTPVLLVYFRHYEVYYLPLTLMLAFGSLCFSYFEKGKLSSYAGLLVLFYLLLKVHILSWLLLPLPIAASLQLIGKGSWITPRNTLRFILIPGILLSLFAYVFVWESWDGSRKFNENTLTEALFLPVSSTDPPPMDRYSLLSFNHLIDYLNLPLLWSPIALLLLLFLPQKKKWSALSTSLGLTLLAFVGIFFLINPLLSMPKDSDLFSLPAPLLLLLALALYQDPNDLRPPLSPLVGAIGALALLSICWIPVHAYPPSLAQRYQLLGQRAYKTYWKGSTGLIEEAANLVAPQQRTTLYETSLKEIRPWLVPKVDIEYGYLLSDYIDHLSEQKDFAAALRQVDSLVLHVPQHFKLPHHRVTVYAGMGNFAEAVKYSRSLIQAGYPEPQKAYEKAIWVALSAQNWDLALNYAQSYLQKAPGNPRMTEVVRRLQTGDRRESLRQLFP